MPTAAATAMGSSEWRQRVAGRQPRTAESPHSRHLHARVVVVAGGVAQAEHERSLAELSACGLYCMHLTTRDHENTDFLLLPYHKLS